MDIRSLHKEFKVFLDKVDTEALPDFIPAEIDIFLNEAQHRLVLTLLTERGLRVPAERKRYIDECLSSLIRFEDIAITDSKGELPSNYLMHLPSVVMYDNVLKPARMYNALDGEIPIMNEDPFNVPTTGYPALSFAGTNVILHGLGNIVKLTYISKPTDVSYKNDITSILPETAHRDIARLAVSVAIETIESQRVQTHRPRD